MSQIYIDFSQNRKKWCLLIPVEDLGEAGGGRHSSRIRPPADPKIRPPADPLPISVLRYPFWLKDPKYFLNFPTAPIFNNFEGEVRAKKSNFLDKNFQKVHKNAFGRLFKN